MNSLEPSSSGIDVASYCYPNKPMDSAVINMTSVHQQQQHDPQRHHQHHQHHQQHHHAVTAISPTRVTIAQPMNIDTTVTMKMEPHTPNSQTSSPREPSSNPTAASELAGTTTHQQAIQQSHSGTEPITAATLLSQMNQLGPSDRCTPSQAQAMGQQLLSIIACHERNTMALPVELQNSFDIFHRCLAVVYGTFFLNLYSKANAPCLLCHGCKSLYPPGQFIHHNCPALPPNIVPCRSRMWRRCLVPLVSQGIDKNQQKQRWKFVLEKFSHNATIAARRNPIPPEAEAQLLEMPELKRGRFVSSSGQRRGSKVAVNSSEEDGMSNGKGGDQGLLDIEPEDYELEGSPAAEERSRTPSQGETPSTALGLAEKLVSEVKRLQQELALSKSKLQAASEVISKMPSEACMREQLAQALATQQALTVERDQAKEQCRLAQERATKLETQLILLRQVHGEMEKHFTS